MATVYWRGDSQAIAQFQTITIAGTVATGNKTTVTCNGKTASYTALAGDTRTLYAEGLAAALQTAALNIPEFSRISASKDDTLDVVNLVSNLVGVPFTITIATTGGGATATLATTTASSGPNHVDDVKNYSTGAYPTNGDTFEVPPGSNALLYGLTALNGVNFAMLRVLGAQIGLPDWNSDGYYEYRNKALELGDADAIEIGDGVTGSAFCRVKVSGSGTCNVKIDNGQGATANAAAPGVYLTSGGSVSLAITVDSGGVGLAMSYGEVVTVASLRLGTEGVDGTVGASDEASAANIGTGATVTATTLFAGAIFAYASTALTIYGGEYTQKSGNIGAITNYGGRIIFNSNGTVGAVTMISKEAILDLTGDSRPLTSITSLSCKQEAFFSDPHGRIPTGTAVVLDEKSYPLCVFAVGPMTLTRS